MLWVDRRLRIKGGLVSNNFLKYQLFNPCQEFPLMPQLIDVSHVSKRGSSLRITLPKTIREKLGLKEEDIVGFYEDNSNIIIKKIE